MIRQISTTALAASLLLTAACAGPSAEAVKAPNPRGELVLGVNDYWYRAAAFDDGEIGVGPMGGPAFASLKLQPNGTWKGMVATYTPGGNPTDYAFKRKYVGYPTFESGLTELTVEGSRITGTGTDVTFTRVEGGFRVTGLWMKQNVDLTVTRASARALTIAFTAKGDGLYQAPSTPPLVVRLAGEAVNPETAPFPQVALAALSLGWGVHPYP